MYKYVTPDFNQNIKIKYGYSVNKINKSST